MVDSNRLHVSTLHVGHIQTFTKMKATHILRKKSEATVPARSTPQHQFDENQTVSCRYPIEWMTEHYKAS